MRRLLCPSLAAATLLLLPGCADDEPAGDRFSLRTPPAHAGAEPLPEVEQARKAAEREADLIRRGLERPRPVLRGWGAALARNDAERAAGYFTLPAVVTLGETETLETARQVEAFNAALPCGVELLHVQPDAGFVVGTFELTQRPKHRCDTPGDLIRIAFVLHDRKIAEWRRVRQDVDPAATPAPTPAATARPGFS